MSRNVEIKIRLRDRGSLAAVRAAVAELADDSPKRLHQRDTYFEVSSGRLKLREITEPDGRTSTELIAYHRPDGTQPRLSTYHRLVPVADGDLARTLRAMLDVRDVVTKRREVSMSGQTRIHIDEVDGLGFFVEFEVVLRLDQSEDDGRRVAESLMKRLGVGGEQCERQGYVDLLALTRSR